MSEMPPGTGFNQGGAILLLKTGFGSLCGISGFLLHELKNRAKIEPNLSTRWLLILVKKRQLWPALKKFSFLMAA
jgi:hypothetical protein